MTSVVLRLVLSQSDRIPGVDCPEPQSQWSGMYQTPRCVGGLPERVVLDRA